MNFYNGINIFIHKTNISINIAEFSFEKYALDYNGQMTEADATYLSDA